MSGGILERGDIVRGDFVLGGYCPGGILSGGYCPGGYCPGGYCPRTLKSGHSVTSLGDTDQRGLSYCLHYRETCAPTCAEHNFWPIRHSQPIQVDRMISYPLVFIYLRF